MKYQTVAVVRTTHEGDDNRWERLDPLILGEDGSGGSQDPSVYICPDNKSSKPWLGFGGSFTEAAAVTLQKMSLPKQEEVMRAYFDPEDGLKFNLGRVHIGSCDFCVDSWTCGDLVETDPELSGFSLEHYEEAILPMIRDAVQVGGAPLTLLASPWSPPPFMKTKPEFNGDGHLKPEWRKSWAKHFVLFVQEMTKLGVPIWAVSIQNEPEAAQVWESCIYSAEEERDFVRDFLGPALKAAGLEHIKIVIWDHNRDGMLERAAVAYSDPQAAKYIWGMGYHWYGDARFETWPDRSEINFEDPRDRCSEFIELRARLGFQNVRQVADLRPDKHIIFTEGCQELSGRALDDALGDWRIGERYAMNIISDLNAGTEGWIDWNLCLDEQGGPNHVGNYCSAPIICHTEKDEILLQPAYWYLGHFSRFIRPGACRVISASSRDALEVVSFVNPDGSLAVVVMNQTDQDHHFWLKVAGSGAAETEAPSRSITTFLVTEASPEAPAPAGEQQSFPFPRVAVSPFASC